MEGVKFILIPVIVIGSLIIGGCAAPDSPTTPTQEPTQKIDDVGLGPIVANTAWNLLAIRERDTWLVAVADMGKPPVLELKADGTFRATTGCGTVNGTYTVDGDTIAFYVRFLSRYDLCLDPRLHQALAVENLIQNSTRYSVEGETLTIAIDDDNDAKLERKP